MSTRTRVGWHIWCRVTPGCFNFNLVGKGSAELSVVTSLHMSVTSTGYGIFWYFVDFAHLGSYPFCYIFKITL